jgi:hypothetical protein
VEIVAGRRRACAPSLFSGVAAVERSFLVNNSVTKDKRAVFYKSEDSVDVASMVTSNTSPETLTLVAKRLRQFGLQRVLFASDRSPGFGNESPKDAWAAFSRLPLTEKEFRTVAENVAPYMR